MNKPVKLLFIFLLFPLAFYAQTTLTGLWMGTLSNDSNTVRKNQTYEIALTEYRGKVYGYSRMNFFVNDTLYYIVKRLKGTVDGDVCEVKDDDIITHNYPRQPEKGVKMISTFRRSREDSVWRLDGEWRTTETRKHRYYAISGKISLNSETDFSKSKIFPHLEELHLAEDVAFYSESKKKEAALIAKTGVADNTVSTKNNSSVNPVPNEPGETDSRTSLAGTSSNSSEGNPAALPEKPHSTVSEPAALPSVAKQPAAKSEEVAGFTGLKKSDVPANRPSSTPANDLYGSTPVPVVKGEQSNVRLNEIKPPQPTEKSMQTEETAVVSSTPASRTPVISAVANPPVPVSPIAAYVKERKTIAPQLVEFSSDSLEIKLYDNGEVDGDTVSILMNGSVLMAKQGLKAAAIRKTIYVPKDSDEITLVLYAENLGKYPPNTGLVVIRDGEEDYQIRFSADLQQNAAITLRRKK